MLKGILKVCQIVCKQKYRTVLFFGADIYNNIVVTHKSLHDMGYFF